MVVRYRLDNAPVIVDVGGGYGGGVTIRLKDNGIEPVSFVASWESIETTKDGQLAFANKRAQVWWKFREALDPDQPDVSLSLIRSGRNGGAILRGPAAEECCRRSGWLGVGARPWPATSVFGRHCSNARKSAAHGADDARQTRLHDQGTRVGSSRSVAPH